MLFTDGIFSSAFIYQGRCPRQVTPGPSDQDSRDICTSRCRPETTNHPRVDTRSDNNAPRNQHTRFPPRESPA